MLGRWAYSEYELRAAVARSRSYRQVLIRLGLSPAGGGSYETLKRRVAALQLDTSHFSGRGWNAGNESGNLQRRAIPLSDALVPDSPVTNFVRLKARLLRLGLLANRCQICGLGPRWNDLDLVLRMDHINGIRTDNRIENLRMICPNCDSQLPTFAGRNSVRDA